MSHMAFPVHTLACDWPDCEETAHDDGCGARESYDSAVLMFADPGNGGDWLHTGGGKDYCPKHWHLDEDWNQVPGPEPKGEA